LCQQESFGFAVWQIQILENAVAAYLVFVHKVTPTVAKSEAESMLAKADKSTLGQLLREIHALRWRANRKYQSGTGTDRTLTGLANKEV
jgi:hypothetical protein